MSVKFDFHTHTRYSDGKLGHIQIVEAAEAKGLGAIAFADHGPDLKVGVPREKLPQMLQDIQLAREDADIPVFASIEANILDVRGTIDVENKFIKRLDFLAIAIHNLETVGQIPVDIHDLEKVDRIKVAQEYLARATKAIERQRVDVFFHPFYFGIDLLLDIPYEDIEEFVRLAATRNVAMELNTKYKVPNDDFLRLCLREGVKLSVGSDAHKLAEVGRVGWALSALRKVGAKREDLMLDSVLK